jgi:hypothetical protein
MSSEGGTGKAKVLRQSPGLKVEMKSKSTNRVYPTLQGIEKLTALLNGLNKKKKAEVITTSYDYATFSATPYGSWYACTVDFLDPTSTKDFYIVNENTWVFTYIGSSSEAYATFAINKPSTYGSYRIWIEGGNGDQFSNALYLGDPYSGVTISNGILSFTNQAAYDGTKDRLKNAEELHLEWLNQFDSYTDDAADAAAENAGFDDNLPFKEFEAYFGHSSIRAKIQDEVDYWLSQTHTDFTGFPEDNYFPYSAAEQTLINNQSQVEIGGVGEGPFTVPTTAVAKIPSNPGPNTCMIQTNLEEKFPYASGLKVKLDVGVIHRTNASVFYTRSKSYKHVASGTFWKQKRQPHRTRVYGSYYNNACGFVSSFNSGFTNPNNHKRSKQEVDYPIYTTLQGAKKDELYGETVISNHSSIPIVLQYTH